MSTPSQRITKTALATVMATSTGNVCVGSFDPPPPGMIVTGSICVLDSDTADSWTIATGVVTAGSQPLGNTLTNTQGSNVIGPVQQFESENLIVYADNANSMIVGRQFHVQFVGIASPSEETSLIAPASATQSILAIGDQQLIQSGRYAYNTPFTVTGIPTWTKSLRVVIEADTGAQPVNLNCFGLTTLYNYFNGVQPTLIYGTSFGFTFYGPLDTTAQMTITSQNIASGGNYWIIAMDDDEFFGQNNNGNPSLLTAPQGIPDTVNWLNGTNGTLVPAPPTGFVQQVDSVTYTNASGTVTPIVFMTEIGKAPRIGYHTAMPINSMLYFPAPITTALGLTATASTLAIVTFSAVYKTLPT
jgi:hypothetical protein